MSITPTQTLAGFPDAASTGVPAGTTLMDSGGLTITTAGTVIDGLNLSGPVYIDAPNVTIKNCRISSADWTAVWIKPGLTGTIVQDCDITNIGPGGPSGANGIVGSGTFLRNNIHHVEHGFDLLGPSLVKDNYIHDMVAAGAPHYDGIEIDGNVSHVEIQHNTIINDNHQTSAVMIDNEFGPMTDIKVDGNYLAGGGFTVYSDGSFSTTNTISGVEFTNNQLGEGYWGYYYFRGNTPLLSGNHELGTTWPTPVSTLCLMEGTKILTPGGEVNVEMLRPGDQVTTMCGRFMPVSWIGRQTVSKALADPVRSFPIRIRVGALDENVPCRDLLLSPDHAVLVGGVLIQAGALVNGTSIIRETNIPSTFTYYHIELDDHSLILAENTPAETFIDNVDRLAFDNWKEHEGLYPDGKPIIEMYYPRAKAYRQVPQRVRMQLAERSTRLFPAVTAAAA